ncbi:hypothetical protein M426DRAFT_265374 [Hypoxylon sp. CI-4A]|nr:hypothetical protein M426DRAFT_265374 [Hypoxylon sp. CI-4A]
MSAQATSQDAREHKPYHDRGNEFRRKSSQYSYPTAGDWGESSRPNTSYDTLYDALWNAKVSYNESEANRFIPFDRLHVAKDRGLVEKALEDGHTPKDQIPGLVAKICSDDTQPNGVSFFRIFAVLVLCEKTKFIHKFVEREINDSHLPLPKAEINGGVIAFINHRHNSEVSEQDLAYIFGNGSEWRQPALNAFNLYQWWANAPFFDRPDGVIPHYLLEASDVLPLIERRTHPDLDELHPDVRELVLEGGFGDVFIAKLHQSHYNIKNEAYDSPSQSFAIKRLKSSNENEFKQEVDALKKHNYSITNHLIPLLATIEKVQVNGAVQYYFLFPKANGDLRYLWRTKFGASPGKILEQWTAGQCLGLSRALSMLHHDQTVGGRDNQPIYGRHGDIKAANILWFSKSRDSGPEGWRLVLSDFGLMRFHRVFSISAETAGRLKKTLTYQAPEFEIRRAKVSRKSDIWAFGCTLLEFATCYISGFQAAEEEFPSARAMSDRRLEKVSEDKFYRMTDDGEGAELKPGVRDWIARLRNHSRCSGFFRDFLDLIEHRMLLVEVDQRPTAFEVSKTLEALIERYWRLSPGNVSIEQEMARWQGLHA